ncbi:hypothetical protein MGO_02806 [Candida albicans P76055]|nr:hypothetical protein MGO_02806 [Candida albicans P76055]
MAINAWSSASFWEKLSILPARSRASLSNSFEIFTSDSLRDSFGIWKSIPRGLPILASSGLGKCGNADNGRYLLVVFVFSCFFLEALFNRRETGFTSDGLGLVFCLSKISFFDVIIGAPVAPRDKHLTKRGVFLIKAWLQSIFDSLI